MARQGGGRFRHHHEDSLRLLRIRQTAQSVIGHLLDGESGGPEKLFQLESGFGEGEPRREEGEARLPLASTLEKLPRRPNTFHKKATFPGSEPGVSQPLDQLGFFSAQGHESVGLLMMNQPPDEKPTSR